MGDWPPGLPVYVVAELLAGLAAALFYGVMTRTLAESQTAVADVDLGDPELPAGQQTAR